MTRIQELIRSGEEQEARDAIDNTSWRGPQATWWTSSIPELTEIIALHDDIIRERKVAAGVSIEEFIADPGVFSHLVGPLAPIAYATCNQVKGQAA